MSSPSPSVSLPHVLVPLHISSIPHDGQNTSTLPTNTFELKGRRYRRSVSKPLVPKGKRDKKVKDRSGDRLPLRASERLVEENCPTDDVYERHDDELSIQIDERTTSRSRCARGRETGLNGTHENENEVLIMTGRERFRLRGPSSEHMTIDVLCCFRSSSSPLSFAIELSYLCCPSPIFTFACLPLGLTMVGNSQRTLQSRRARNVEERRYYRLDIFM